MDMVLMARKVNAAYCERHGIPCEHPFTAEELAPIHEGLADAERDLYGDEQRDLRDEQASENRHNDPRRGCVPREFKR